MNVQEEINKINERIETLNKDVQSLVNELEEVMENEFPQDDDEYWYIDDEGGVFSTYYDKHYIDRYRQKIGNIFRTKEQAEFAVEKLKVEAELRKFSRPFKVDENNYYIELYLLDETLSIDGSDYFKTQGTSYFESVKIANEAIDTIGADRIKKYIFGVED